MAALDLHLLADGLPVGDALLGEGDFDAELILQLADDHIQVLLSQAGDKLLAGLGVVFKGDGGVLLHQPQKGLGNFALIPLALELDRHGEAWLWEGSLFKENQPLGIADGIPCDSLRQLADDANIPSANIIGILLFFAPDGHQLAHPLRHTGPDVGGAGGGGQLAGHHLDIGHLPHKGVGDRFENKGGQGVVGVAVQVQLLAAGGLHLLPGVIGGGGQDGDNGVEQGIDGLGGEGGAAEHRGDGAGAHTLEKALADLLLGEVLPGEELIHQLLGGLGHRFLDVVLQGVHHPGGSGGDLHVGLAAVGGIGEGPVVQ